MSTKLEDLTPEVMEMAKKLLAKLEEAGLRCVVTYTYRTAEEQQALFSQGRLDLESVNAKRAAVGLYKLAKKENTYTVTNCDGVRSLSAHQTREALDVNPVDKKGNPTWDAKPEVWKKIGEVSKSIGFDWGGYWAPLDKNGLGWDLPHHQKKKA
jgi:peptidoglycan L-alanyl-D-glutamate endopeptidase CwlK